MTESSLSAMRFILRDTLPSISLYAARSPAALSAFIMSATPSASARSILPARNARLVNSPLSAARAPFFRHSSSAPRIILTPPCR